MSSEEHDILIQRGAPMRHVQKSAKLLADAFAGLDTDWKHSRDALLAFPEQHPQGGIAFLLGERGRGKTQAAVCMMRANLLVKDTLTPRIHSVRYVRAAELFMAFRDAQKTGAERRTLREFADPRILIIDDLHEQGGTDAEQRTMTLLLDDRLGSERYTVFITNATRETLTDSVGKSIGSRFHEGGAIIEFTGRNWRREGAQS